MITVVVPVFNEEKCLPALFARLLSLQESSAEEYEFVFVDDGSRDQSLSVIKDWAKQHSNVRFISFSRNFGHEAATTAALDHASGDAIVIIDADLQDPPEVIPSLIEKWREGYQVVYARRRVREGETVFKRMTSWLFYRLISWLSNVAIPPDTGDFRLMDRVVVEQFRRCRETSRFVRGLVAWTGFKQTAILYDRDERYGGVTKYNVLKLIALALDAVLGFSDYPLRIVVYLGLLVCAASTGMAIKMAAEKLFWGISIPGYALLSTGLFFLGGTQLFVLGLLGEYIGRIYRQSQDRPLYIIGEKSRELPQGDEGWWVAGGWMSRCK
jgi:polyisoprenyl-phosphate glycosyltransferase